VRPRQQTFVQEYLIDLNAKRAAERAGYKPGYARHASVQLLRAPAIRAAVAAGMAERARRTQITADRVLQEYARIAFADIRRMTDWGKAGIELREQHVLSDDDAAAIAEVSRPGSANTMRLKLYDKRPALEALARHLGVFTPRNRPFAGDFSNEAQRRARAALKDRIEKIIAERGNPGPEREPGI
jgi:phage terminase small subunit